MTQDYTDIGLDNKFRAMNGVSARPRTWLAEYDQNVQSENTPFIYGRKKTTGTVAHTGNYSLTGNLAVIGAATIGGTTIEPAYSKGEYGYGVNQTERQWTNETSFTTMNASKFRLDGDSFRKTYLYFEVLGCVELADRTASYQLYNVTDGTPVTNSTITTTNVGTAYEWSNAEIVRSGTLVIPSGNKTYEMQFKQGGGGTAEGDAAQLLKAQLIFVNF